MHEIALFVEDHAHRVVVGVTDANCQGFHERVRRIDPQNPPAPVVLAVPDPHVERWLLLDGAAFKAVFGQGCDAPDRKCSRNRYKELLIAAIREAGCTTCLGGIEYAEDIVGHMDLDRATQSDTRFAGSSRTCVLRSKVGNSEYWQVPDLARQSGR